MSVYPDHLLKFAKYIEDCDDYYCRVKNFDTDWAPVGPQVRKEMLQRCMILHEDTREGGVMIITRAVRRALKDKETQ